MRSRFVVVVLGVLLAVAVVAAQAGAVDVPNQGDPSKVLKVNNPNVSCDDPVPTEKVEGDFTQRIKVWSKYPIDYVTVKSGKNAYVVSSDFGTYMGKYWAEIKLSKDVSNYVIWKCPKTY